MPPKKQSPRNAFYYYMLHVEKELKKSGKPFPGGMRGLADFASPGWQALNPAEKKVFEEMAHAEKGCTKYTSQGETYEEVAREKKALQDKNDLMLRTIQTTLVNLGRNTGLAYHSFFLFHLNFYCKTGNGVHYPAEIALSAFSIKNGVATPFHTLVNPGRLPTGYAYKSQQTSEESHQIDLSKGLGEKSMEKIVVAMDQYIQKFPGHEDEMPPLYTLEKFIPSTEEVLTRWAETYNKPEGFYRVFPLEELFHQMKNFSLKPMAERQLIDGRPDEGFIFSSMAAKKLGDDPYSYRPRIACELHEELDVVQHCSRSYVIRWGWVMADHLCGNMDVQMVPGRHCPYGSIVRQLENKMSALQVDLPPVGRSARPAKPRAAGRGLASPKAKAPGNRWHSAAPLAGPSGVGCVAGPSSLGCVVGPSAVGCVAGPSSLGYVVGPFAVGCVAGPSSLGCVAGASAVGYVAGASAVGCIVGPSAVGCVAGAAAQFADHEDKDDEMEEEAGIRSVSHRQPKARNIRMPANQPTAYGRGSFLLQDLNDKQFPPLGRSSGGRR